MIFYFTGTGNSRFIAEQIAQKTNDELISINDILRNKIDKNFTSQKPYVFVGPIYAGSLPKVMTDFIKESQLNGNNKVYVLANCGSDSTGTIVNIEKLINSKFLKLQGFEEIKMPANYIILYNPKSKDEGEEIIKSSLTKITQIAEKIDREEYFTLDRKISGVDKVRASDKMAKLFLNKIAKDNNFHTTGGCVGCGKCEQICPLSNITMVDKKPKWNGNCTHCVGCISICPAEAIEYKNKTVGRNRYYLPKESKF